MKSKDADSSPDLGTICSAFMESPIADFADASSFAARSLSEGDAVVIPSNRIFYCLTVAGVTVVQASLVTTPIIGNYEKHIASIMHY